MCVRLLHHTVLLSSPKNGECRNPQLGNGYLPGRFGSRAVLVRALSRHPDRPDRVCSKPLWYSYSSHLRPIGLNTATATTVIHQLNSTSMYIVAILLIMPVVKVTTIC